MQSGTQAASNIRRDLANDDRTAFRYVDKGSMATIGRNKAVAQVGRMQFSGVIAWLMWLFIHILFLVGFRNRVGVLFEWAWAYLTWQHGSRVIVDVPIDGELSQAVGTTGSRLRAVRSFGLIDSRAEQADSNRNVEVSGRASRLTIVPSFGLAGPALPDGDVAVWLRCASVRSAFGGFDRAQP